MKKNTEATEGHINISKGIVLFILIFALFAIYETHKIPDPRLGFLTGVFIMYESLFMALAAICFIIDGIACVKKGKSQQKKKRRNILC